MLELFSPAKINLFLRMVNKRPDGYHNLSSLFQTVDLCDKISFQTHEKDLLTCSSPTLPTNENNLILKATRLFRQKTGIPIHLKVHLEKIIPIEAGLGGGSSNAASTLWAMNRLSGLNIEEKQLMKWGSEIGSDVSFFLSQGTAYCTGRGEKVQFLEPLPQQSVLIVKPDIGLSTSAVYKKLIISIKDFRTDELQAYLKGEIPCFNDLEEPAFIISPELFKVKQKLLTCGFQTVLLSGSGSSFFCLGRGKIPVDNNLTYFQANFINRRAGEWFKVE